MKKFNEHFRALTGLHNASNNQMLKQSCNQLPDAITRSRIFCDHLSQCAMVVGVLTGLRNARERAMYSNTVPWPMHLGQWPHSLRNQKIQQCENRLTKQWLKNARTHFQCKLVQSLTFAKPTNDQAIQTVQVIVCQCHHPGQCPSVHNGVTILGGCNLRLGGTCSTNTRPMQKTESCQ